MERSVKRPGKQAEINQPMPIQPTIIHSTQLREAMPILSPTLML